MIREAGLGDGAGVTAAGQRATTDHGPQTTDVKVTTADVLEAIHLATGTPIVADFYTRLYAPHEVSVADGSIFEALNQVADRMRMRWTKDGEWLQFRTTSFYDDRLKEVPNRLLARWAASRREHGELTLDDLSEIARLADAQLDAASLAEGAKLCWGLAEWDLARIGTLRSHVRFLAALNPAQRQAAASGSGISFQHLTLPQQEQFLGLARGVMGSKARLEELATTVMHVEYTLPGSWLWYTPESLVAGFPPFLPPRVRERTRSAALQAARRVDPQAEDAQIRPAHLTLAFIYRRQDKAGVHVRRIDPNGSFGRYLTRP
jgi:hypothetical protein